MSSPASLLRARNRNAAAVRNALRPGGDRMVGAHAALIRKFEDAVEAVEAGLPPDELRKRAKRLQAAWLGSVAYEAARKQRGEPYQKLELKLWLAERVAIATRDATVSSRDAARAARAAFATKNGIASKLNEAIPSEETVDPGSIAPEEVRRVSDVLA